MPREIWLGYWGPRNVFEWKNLVRLQATFHIEGLVEPEDYHLDIGRTQNRLFACP
jgi:hypothetical protein